MKKQSKMRRMDEKNGRVLNERVSKMRRMGEKNGRVLNEGVIKIDERVMKEFLPICSVEDIIS